MNQPAVETAGKRQLKPQPQAQPGMVKVGTCIFLVVAEAVRLGALGVLFSIFRLQTAP